MVAEGRRETRSCRGSSLVTRLAQVNWRPLVTLTSRTRDEPVGLGRVIVGRSSDKGDIDQRVGGGGRSQVKPQTAAPGDGF